MRSATPGRTADTWVGVLFGLTAWALIAPQPAHAGCSRYVRSKLLPAGVEIGLDVLDRAGAPGEAPGPSSRQDPERPAPCSGAMCSGQPSLPLSPAPPDLHRAGACAILVTSTRVDRPEAAATPHDEGDIRPTHCGSSVFHPPRPSLFLLAS